MEMTINKFSLRKILEFHFYKEQKPFLTKREINWPYLSKLSVLVVCVMILVVIMIPQEQLDQDVFHEKTQSGISVESSDNNPSEQTANQIQQGRVNMQSVHSSLDHLYAPKYGSGYSGNSGGKDRNSSMILARNNGDSKIQLSAGTRILIKLIDKVVISTQPMPIVGMVINDVTHDNDLAIAKGAKILGTAAFDDNTERANITINSIIFTDGRERQLSAVAIGTDEQIGVNGNVRSNALQSTVGHTLSRFVGAYAQGSMNTGQFGAQAGGHENGIRNAIAATAEDRANAIADDMKKSKKWIELSYGTQFTAVLNQSFIYREPGNTNGGR